MKDSFRDKASRMKVLKREDGMLDIQMPKEDVVVLSIALGQVEKVDFGIRFLHPAEEAQVAQDVNRIKVIVDGVLSDGQELAVFKISQDDFVELASYISDLDAATGGDLEDCGISLQDFEALEESLSLIEYGLKPEEEILKIEQEKGIEVPRIE